MAIEVIPIPDELLMRAASKRRSVGLFLVVFVPLPSTALPPESPP